jgi:hypothetical protein
LSQRRPDDFSEQAEPVIASAVAAATPKQSRFPADAN